MRPKFKIDTYCIPMHDGVYLRGNNRHLMLKGKSLYPLLKRLIPNLDGNTTLEEITRGLDADRKRMITNLLEKLFAHRFLYDTSQDQSHALCAVDLETYAPNIAFIESFQTSAAYRFECFRNKRLLIIGCGSSFTSLVQASLNSGVRQIDVMITPGDESASSRQKLRDLFASSAPEHTAQLISTLSWEQEADARNTIQTYDAILHIAEQPMLAQARLLNRLCIEQRKPFIQAIIIDDRAWIGPLVHPETAGCWECAWRRLQATQPDFAEQCSLYEFHDRPLAPRSRFLTMPKAMMIANQLLFALFRYFTQTDAPATVGYLSTIDLETCLSEHHTFLPHPQCLACQHAVALTACQFLEQIQRLQQRVPLDQDAFLEDFARCVDERLGLFPAIDDGHFVQAPLAVSQVTLSHPLPGKLPFDSLNVVAASTDPATARLRAAQKACERYAACLVDYRRLLSLEAVPQHAFPVIAARQFVGIKPLPPEDEMWTWALDVQAQQVCLVPAMSVFSSPGKQTRGIASGMIWEEAICQGLLDWSNALTVEQVKGAQQAYLQVDLATTPLTPEGTYLYRLLTATAGQIIAYNVTGPLQVPTFAICVGEKVVAYCTHWNIARALSIGLEQALQQYQSEQFQQPAYAPAPVPDLPLALRSNQLHVPRSTLPDAWSARQEWLLQRLQANGLRAYAIPLDHDPVLAQMSPFIVHVLLRRAEGKNGEELHERE